MGETRDQGNGAMELGKKMQMEGERQLRKEKDKERQREKGQSWYLAKNRSLG